jgi:hypothetical protein
VADHVTGKENAARRKADVKEGFDHCLTKKLTEHILCPRGPKPEAPPDVIGNSVNVMKIAKAKAAKDK